MMPKYSASSLIPILLSLGDYATERAKTSSLSLSSYLELACSRLNIAGVTSFLLQALQTGHCIVLLDALDEVSDQQMRREIQEAIRSFILENRDTSDDI